MAEETPYPDKELAEKTVEFVKKVKGYVDRQWLNEYIQQVRALMKEMGHIHERGFSPEGEKLYRRVVKAIYNTGNESLILGAIYDVYGIDLIEDVRRAYKEGERTLEEETKKLLEEVAPPKEEKPEETQKEEPAKDEEEPSTIDMPTITDTVEEETLIEEGEQTVGEEAAEEAIEEEKAEKSESREKAKEGSEEKESHAEASKEEQRRVPSIDELLEERPDLAWALNRYRELAGAEDDWDVETITPITRVEGSDEKIAAEEETKEENASEGKSGEERSKDAEDKEKAEKGKEKRTEEGKEKEAEAGEEKTEKTKRGKRLNIKELLKMDGDTRRELLKGKIQIDIGDEKVELKDSEKGRLLELLGEMVGQYYVARTIIYKGKYYKEMVRYRNNVLRNAQELAKFLGRNGVETKDIVNAIEEGMSKGKRDVFLKGWRNNHIFRFGRWVTTHWLRRTIATVGAAGLAVAGGLLVPIAPGAGLAMIGTAYIVRSLLSTYAMNNIFATAQEFIEKHKAKKKLSHMGLIATSLIWGHGKQEREARIKEAKKEIDNTFKEYDEEERNAILAQNLVTTVINVSEKHGKWRKWRVFASYLAGFATMFVCMKDAVIGAIGELKARAGEIAPAISEKISHITGAASAGKEATKAAAGSVVSGHEAAQQAAGAAKEIAKGVIPKEIYTVRPGEGPWHVSKRVLEYVYGEKFTSLPKKEQILLIDKLKDYFMGPTHTYKDFADFIVIPEKTKAYFDYLAKLGLSRNEVIPIIDPSKPPLYVLKKGIWVINESVYTEEYVKKIGHKVLDIGMGAYVKPGATIDIFSKVENVKRMLGAYAKLLEPHSLIKKAAKLSTDKGVLSESARLGKKVVSKAAKLVYAHSVSQG